MNGNILELQNLSAWYSEGKDVLSGFSLQLRPHEAVGLIGLNGAGKTTFLKTLSGLHESLRCDSIRLHSRPVSFRDKDFKRMDASSGVLRAVRSMRTQFGRPCMMKMSFNVTAKKLFGVKYERLMRTLFLDLVVFWGLHIAGFQVQIASPILYLMTSAFSAGVMWKALSSGDNRANLENMFMLPFEGRTLVFSYVAALGAYTLLTKTAGLLAVIWAVADWNWTEIWGSILCALLSCDPALEQAVRFLPGQQKAFCIPYCLFLFGCNLAADIIFLCSWQFQIGGIMPLHLLTAASFALLSAAGSVLLEWYCPIRGWKIESDLWHHPRKYVVPAIMMLLAGLVGMF